MSNSPGLSFVSIILPFIFPKCMKAVKYLSSSSSSHRFHLCPTRWVSVSLPTISLLFSPCKPLFTPNRPAMYFLPFLHFLPYSIQLDSPFATFYIFYHILILSAYVYTIIKYVNCPFFILFPSRLGTQEREEAGQVQNIQRNTSLILQRPILIRNLSQPPTCQVQTN